MTTNVPTGADAAAGDAPRLADAAMFDKAHEALRADSAIQFDFTRIPPPKPPPQWLSHTAEWLSGLGPVVRFLFWSVIALIVVGVLYLLFQMAQRRWNQRSIAADAAAVDEWRPEAKAARELLRDAEAMAATGDHAGAARLLLWRSIEDIQARRPDFVKPALTSREIARADTLPPAARTAFGLIAARVEASHFAARGLDEAGWHDCRAAYEAFAFDRNWS